MHPSRLGAVLIDCNVTGLEQATHLRARGLGWPVDRDNPATQGNYRVLGTPIEEPSVEVQRGTHESRVHIDTETDDIPAEVSRLEKLGAKVIGRMPRWTHMQAPTDQRFCVVRVQRRDFPKTATRWD